MTRASTVKPPLQPILRRLRTQAKVIDVQVQYMHDGVLTGEVSFTYKVNGSKGRLGDTQTDALLSFVERNGLLSLVSKLSKFGTAVKY